MGISFKIYLLFNTYIKKTLIHTLPYSRFVFSNSESTKTFSYKYKKKHEFQHANHHHNHSHRRIPNNNDTVKTIPTASVSPEYTRIKPNQKNKQGQLDHRRPRLFEQHHDQSVHRSKAKTQNVGDDGEEKCFKKENIIKELNNRK